MNVNVKVSNELSEEDMKCVNDVFYNGYPYQEKRVGEFFEVVENMNAEFEKLSASNKKIKAYLRLWKGVAQKFYQEIIPFKFFLDRVDCPREYRVQISDNTTQFDAIISNGIDKWTFEIVTAYIDKQEIYRTHNLNTNGWVSGNQTYTKESNGDLVADNEPEMVETTPGKKTEALTSVIGSIKNTVSKKQEKKYRDTYLVVVIGCNAIFNDNKYAVDQVQKELENINDQTFKNIYVLDYKLSDIIKLKAGSVW